jgi:hypothetical protein
MCHECTSSLGIKRPDLVSDVHDDANCIFSRMPEQLQMLLGTVGAGRESSGRPTDP